ncbi:hypothetical protein P8452_74031 [Trifolium repens]|nr:hypothetical protein P8452_74031 [Trifolium repens]
MTTSYTILDFLPVGFRFRPTDEELVNHYLKNKLLGNDYIVNNVIAEVDFCKFEPWELKDVSMIKSDDREWFFLCPYDYKYPNSKRFNRKTKCGFWKPTGRDRNIKIRGTSKISGIKKTLVYYQNHVPNDVKTNWIMHEYHDVTFKENQRTFILCRLKEKDENKAEEETDTMICEKGEPSRHMSSDNENQETLEGISNVSGTLPKINMESTMFEAPYQVERYLPFSTQRSSNEQNVSITNSQLHDAYFGNVNINTLDTYKW